MYIENITAYFRVADLQRSIRFYVDVLGFSLEWGGDAEMGHICSVGRDGQSLMLSTVDGSREGVVWTGVGDILDFRKPLLDAGATEVLAPQNQPWAYEMRFADPDGHILWFGSSSLSD